MLLLQLLQRTLQRLRHKPMWAFLLLILLVVLLDRSAATSETEAPPQQPQLPTTTPEPDASPGCKAPDIRFSIVRPDATTEPPYAKFETTQLYLPEDYTTADEDFVERINIDLTGGGGGRHMSSGDNNKLAAAVVNPYEVDLGDDHHALALHTDDGMDDGDLSDDDDEDEDSTADPLDPASSRKRNNANRRENGNKKRRPSGRRRRLENDNGQSRGRGSRYRRQVQSELEPHAPMKIHHDPDASPETDKWSGAKLAAEGDVYYVHIDDILKSRSPNPELRLKLHKLKKKKKKSSAQHREEEEEAHRCAPAAAGGEDEERCHKQKAALRKQSKKKTKKAIEATVKSDVAKSTSGGGGGGGGAKQHHRRRGDSHEDKRNEAHHLHKRSVNPRWQRYADTMAAGAEELLVASGGPQDGIAAPPLNGGFIMPGDAVEQYEAATTTNGTDDELQRVKRKSGKTTGALSRPKGGGDSSSKTTSRKDKGIYDEEGGYSPVHPDETDSAEEEEESEEIDIHQQFTEVSEIRFPGEIGPLGDRRLCKIRCVKGKWVGPLCATNEEDENGNVNFQPLYKSCHVNRIPPHLLLSYRNISVTPIPSVRGRRNRTSKSTFVSNTPINVGWDLPHGHSLQARCKDIGLYKLLGESRVLCSNGLWAPRMPSCVPTTLLTNFSDDSAPSIRLRVTNGSGAFEPSGVLAVLPKSTIQLDCFYPRVRGTPEWTWTSWYMQYPTGWSNGHEDRGLRYRLTIRDIQQSDSGTFTCTSPRGLTNSIPIVVATSTCPRLPEPVSPLALRLEGNKLGQRAMYRCPPGYRIDGVVNATCLASGSWSSPPPTCQAVQCPRLVLDDPHLSLVELNTSAWGRAVFKCQWGFRLTGPPGLECEPTGVWSGPVPRCKAIQCPAKVPPLNGRIGGINLHQRRLTVGALITFSCNEGHTLVGEPSIICTETGAWSHEPPYCQSQCPYPGDPPNGLIAPLKFNYDSGDFLDVQCRPGYVLHSEKGPVERPLCQPSGNWSVEVPKCRSYQEV